jgi:hypothetical protein
MFTWTDPETKSTFLTKTVDEVPTALQAKRAEFAGAGKTETKLAVAHHGTPHIWPPEPGFPHGRPRLDKIFAKETVGEGAWANGAGFYSAQEQDTGDFYRQSLTGTIFPPRPNMFEVDGVYYEAGKSGLFFKGDGETITKAEYGKALQKAQAEYDEKVKNAGALYKLDIPDDVAPKLLDWDKPLSEQSKYVKSKISGTVNDFAKKYYPGESGIKYVWDKFTGERFYNSGEIWADLQDSGVISWHDGSKGVSEYLASIGIPGNKYFDGSSRNKNEGTRNYVIWDQDVLDRVKILERNNEKLGAVAAMGDPDTPG